MSYAELVAATNFSFLRGASQPADMVKGALALGHNGLGIADRNSVAGVVQAWRYLKDLRKETGAGRDFKLLTGARLVFADNTPDIVAYPTDRTAWGQLTRMLSAGNLRTEKGNCLLYFADLLKYCEGMALIILPPLGPLVSAEDNQLHSAMTILRNRSRNLWIGATMDHQGSDARRLAELRVSSAATGIPLVAVNDALYASPEYRPLHDVMTCIRDGTTISKAGKLLLANAEHYLKPESEMERLFAKAPEAIAAIDDVLAAVHFDLAQLAYEYPHEPVPRGYTPQGWLETLIDRKGKKRWPQGLPDGLQELLDNEIGIIGRLGFAAYFLTVHDIVRFANKHGILCQGRGSAANSAICYVLGITSVDPVKHSLLFSRFMSEERAEPPDIDVDFEHERREEVMQYIYKRYGRHRAGIVATVIHYRPRSAVREVGKALGMTEDVTSRLAGLVWGSFGSKPDESRLREAGFDPDNPEIARLKSLSEQLLNYPRHLSQHVGGFVLTEDRLDETVPIHNAAMEDRTFIEWDKDDIDALGLMKVDVLSLGMLTCIRKSYDMIVSQGGPKFRLDNVPDEDEAVFEMLCAADTIGVFQVESRAQMSMLPRLQPREFYDIAIQVAIVRPGPIQGNMVHPYLKRRDLFRRGQKAFEFPKPSPPNDPDELIDVLGKTLGVPLFQEQAMKLAIVTAKFTDSEANELRRAMATFRNVGTMHKFEEKLVGGMVARGYERDFAERCYKQIQGFGSYGFPESHAIAFARLAWISAWIKWHYPAIFAASLLNSQPMGFYAPAQIVSMAKGHGVRILPIDVNHSDWDNAVVPDATASTKEGLALRLGLRQVDGFQEAWAQAMTSARPFVSIEDLARRGKLPSRALHLLADADAVRSLGHDRREGAWEARRTPPKQLPLFAAMKADELGEEEEAGLPAMRLGEHIAADYQTIRLSLKGHPMQILRPIFSGEGVRSCAEISASKNGALAKVAGVVLVRQRPGEGKAIFVTLEDETGVTNVIMWARTFKRFRLAVMSARLMEVQGEVQRSPEGVVHLMTHRIVDRTVELSKLSEIDETKPMLARADEFANSVPGRHVDAGRRHPRDVRILPKSRDFH
jgi:error-prone DNA polymerase